MYRKLKNVWLFLEGGILRKTAETDNTTMYTSRYTNNTVQNSSRMLCMLSDNIKLEKCLFDEFVKCA